MRLMAAAVLLSAAAAVALHGIGVGAAEAEQPAPPPPPPHVFNATGTVAAGAYTSVVTHDLAEGGLVPVHGIQVCVHDTTDGTAADADADADAAVLTLLNTTSGAPACGYTDRGGAYNISGIVGADPHDGTRADVVVSVISRGYGGSVTVVGYDNAGGYRLYRADSDAAADYGGILHAADFELRDRGFTFVNPFGLTSPEAGAARIVSALSDGMAFFDGFGRAPANLTVQWQHRGSPEAFPDEPGSGAPLPPGSAVMRLDGGYGGLSDRSLWRWSILRELAHHVHALHNPSLDRYCPVAYTAFEIVYKQDEACAWGEGWASLAPHLIDGSAVASAPHITIDIEAANFAAFEVSGRAIGEAVPGRVAAAMWDMADNATGHHDGGRDDVAAGVGALLGVFFNGTYGTFAEFYDRWEIDMRNSSAERIARLHGMSFAIPNTVPYYRPAGELGGLFGSGLAGLELRPSHVAVSADGSIFAVTSERGRGLQLVNASGGGGDARHMGLYAARGHDYACTLALDRDACLGSPAAPGAGGPGPALASMDGVAFSPDAGRILVTDGHRNRIAVFEPDGGYMGSFGAPRAAAGSPGGPPGPTPGGGEFHGLGGVAFLPDGTAAVADGGSRSIRLLEIGGDGASAAGVGQFASYWPRPGIPFTAQHLAPGPGGSLYAAGADMPGVWRYPLGPGGQEGVLRISDPSLGRLGGIAVGPDGLAYVADSVTGRIRAYDMDGRLGGAYPADAASPSRSGPYNPYGLRPIGGNYWNLVYDTAMPLGASHPSGPAGTAAGRMPLGASHPSDPASPSRNEPDGPHGPLSGPAGSRPQAPLGAAPGPHPPGAAPSVLATAPIPPEHPYPSHLGGVPLTVRTVEHGLEGFAEEFGSPGTRPWQDSRLGGIALGPPDSATGDMRVYVAYPGGVKIYERDRERPAVERVWAHTPDGPIGPGGTAEIAATFSERVTVEGAPVLPLEVGGSAGAAGGGGGGGGGGGAAYASGSGSSTLTFAYTPASGAGPGHLDNAAAGSITLGPGAAIMDGSGNAADLSLPARGTAASLAANAALWIAPTAAAPPFEIGPVPPVKAAEHREVRIALNAAGAAPGSYSLAGAPEGAAILPNGTLLWVPGEAQDGAHEFTVSAALAGDPAATHTRAVRIDVAEANEPPFVGAIPDMRVAELSELRFDVNATDVDLPAQRLRYGLEAGAPAGATVLPNGTFVWTPSAYDAGVHSITVSVSDGLGHAGDAAGRQGAAALAAFSVDVADAPQPPPSVVRVYAPGGLLGGGAAPPAAIGTGTGAAGVTCPPFYPSSCAVFLPPSARRAGDEVAIRVEFSAPVVVRGLPELRLDAGGGGGPPALAAYDSGNGTSTIALVYTVEHGHNSGCLEYAGTEALSVAGGWLEAASGGDAVPLLSLPAPGSPGSLSSQPSGCVTVATTSPVLDIGVIGDWSTPGSAAHAALLAAAEFNAGSPGMMLNVTPYSGLDGRLSPAHVLRSAHAGGAGPGLYVGRLPDRDLNAAMPYAAEHGIVLVSTDSSAPSLAVEGDLTFRLRPSDALQAGALARLASLAGASSVYAVLETASYGAPAAAAAGPGAQQEFSHGFAAALADSAVPRLNRTVVLDGSPWNWFDAADAAAAELDAAVRSGDAPAAVVYLGSPHGLSELVWEAAAVGHAGLLSAAWFASDLSAGSSVLAGLDNTSTAAFAAHVGLTAVRWAAPDTALAREIGSQLAPGGAPGAAPAHARAAYDAVSLIGAAAAGAGSTDAARIADGLHHAAASYEGALGDISLDPAGDLWVPARYEVWRVERGGQAGAAAGIPEWVRQPDLDEARACSLALGTGSLDYGSVVPGLYTQPARQTVINSGQMPFAGVGLVASPWYADSDGACSAGGRPSLPAGISEVLAEPGGAFVALGPGQAAVAGGLEPGGEAPLWYRINLTGYADLPPAVMSQCVTYVAEC